MELVLNREMKRKEYKRRSEKPRKGEEDGQGKQEEACIVHKKGPTRIFHGKSSVFVKSEEHFCHKKMSTMENLQILSDCSIFLDQFALYFKIKWVQVGKNSLIFCALLNILICIH